MSDKYLNLHIRNILYSIFFARIVTYNIGCGREITDLDTAKAIENNALQEADNYQSAEYCKDCHPSQYDQWRQSMHSYATRSPVFEAMAAKAYRDSAGGVDVFCTKCHSVIGENLQENPLIHYTDRSSIAKEGITCVTCHQTTAHTLPIGNANITLDPLGVLYGPFGNTDQSYHASATNEILETPELCGSCHDVFMYPGIEIEQAYSEYVGSEADNNDVRCQDCHMSQIPGIPTDAQYGPIAVVEGENYPERKLSSHFFTGPDYTLVEDWPFVGQDNSSILQSSLDRTATLLSQSIEIADISAIRNNGYIDLTVELYNKTIGHNVPTGFTSERQLWLDIQVLDSENTVIFQSGDLDSYGDIRNAHSWDVQSGAVAEDTQLYNLQSENRVIKRHYMENGENEPNSVIEYYDAVFPFQATTIIRNSLEPQETRSVEYSISLGQSSTSYTIHIALLYRNLPPYVLRELQLQDLTEKLHIFTLDETEVVVR